ncbi:MAG: replicative DNA helicase [Bacteroidales bacterium]
MATERSNKKNNSQRTNTTIDHLNAQIGKIPPQAVEVEQAVLGALMLEREAYSNVADILTAESFYRNEHRQIFEVISSLSQRNQPIDLLVATQELKDKGLLDEVGGVSYITKLTSLVASAAHIEFHARIIAQKHIQRELIRVSREILEKAYDDSEDVEDLINFSETSLFGVAERQMKGETLPIKMVLKEAAAQIEENAKKPDGMSGSPSGFRALDSITSGWQPTDLVIVAARPSMGKTAFVLSMARNMIVDHNLKVGFFSLEMSSLQLVNRLLAAETGLGSDKIKTGRLSKEEWTLLHDKIRVLEDAQLFIDDTPALSIFDFRAKCRRLKKQSPGLDVVIIDYLQLMTAGVKVGSREQEVSTISRSLKAVAKELNVPILALSQLNRSVESREGKKPQLSDLRESGAIEQDADIVSFIHRPEYYGIHEDEKGRSTKDLAEIIIAKHRNGAVGTINLQFVRTLARFQDFEVNPDFLSTVADTKTVQSKMNSDVDERWTTKEGAGKDVYDSTFDPIDSFTGDEF